MIELLLLAKVNPIPVVFAFWASSFGTMGFGVVLIRRGWVGLKRGSYPLTKDHDLEGCGATFAAMLIIGFGVVVCVAGLGMLVACSFRLHQLLF